MLHLLFDSAYYIVGMLRKLFIMENAIFVRFLEKTNKR